MTDDTWTLWVLAGPGAFAERTLGDALGGAGRLPAGVRVFAEAVGAPTLLEQLTGEWPAERLVGGPGEPLTRSPAAAERDLGRLLAWGPSPGSTGRRALIILGDLLSAIGAAPLSSPLGGDRPTYPSTIVIKRPKASGSGFDDGTYTMNPPGSSGSPSNVYTIGGASTGAFTAVLGLMQVNDLIHFSGDNDYYKRIADTSGPTGTQRNYLIVDSAGQATAKNEVVTITDDASASYTVNRSLDAVGPAEVSRTTRRIDALVAALAEHPVDLLVSDAADLAQIEGLRRLAPHAGVLLGGQEATVDGAALLGALVGALAAAPGLTAEALAGAVVDRSEDAGRPLIALRSAGVGGLLDALDARARRALDVDGPLYRRCVADACEEAGDLADLVARIAAIDRERARAIEAGVARATVALSRSRGPAPRLGVRLDEPGLQLGARTAWGRLQNALRGDPSTEVMCRTLEDVALLAARARRGQSTRPRLPAAPLQWIEYRPEPRPDLEAKRDFEEFLASALGPARHVALMIRGARVIGHPASVAVVAGESLSIVDLVGCLREALNARGRGPLAMLVFDDPELLSLEIAYEARDVAAVLLTSVAGGAPLTRAELEESAPEALVRSCEQEGADGLRGAAGASIAALVHPWRREVARLLANHIVAAVEAGGARLQGIDLRHMEALCRRFDRVCQMLYDNLGEAAVLSAVKRGARAPSLIQWINWLQVHGGKEALYTSDSAVAQECNAALGDVYNWIAVASASISEGGAPFWIHPAFVEDRSPDGYCARLRLTVAANQPRDYRALCFHQDVRLHALLAAGRLLEGAGARRLWGLIALGLDYAPESARRRHLGRLLREADAATYFTNLGAPPLLSLDLERDDRGAGYELRLSSSESTAVLVRQESVVDLEAIDRSLDGLGYVLSRGVASSEGWRYLESLGASLAEDVVSDLREQLERERAAMIAAGRGRDAHLALALPRELMRYPWELMRLPPRAPGQPSELLAERFAVGRQMWSDRAPPRARRSERVRMLIVADPRTSASALPGARAEAAAIQALCAAMARELGAAFAFECEASIGEALTRTVLRTLIRDGDYDVLHFAGHGTYHSARPETSGWLLSDGLLTVTELRNTLAWSEAPPWLIYANACDAGMIGDQAATRYQGEVHGMAEACIRAGVNAYVAPLWKIRDESARMLATEFYRRLLLERSTIGVALHHARIQVRRTWETLRGDAELGDISWAGVVLFGNPAARLNDPAE